MSKPQSVYGKQSTAGFTLIELLVAATILAVLTTIAVVSFQSTNMRARDGKRKGDLEQIRAALELYRSDTTYGAYPQTTYGSMLSALKNAGYISEPLPKDPKGTVEYQYTATATTYCLCALIEASGGGNSSTNSCAFVSSGGTFYCVVNP